MRLKDMPPLAQVLIGAGAVFIPGIIIAFCSGVLVLRKNATRAQSSNSDQKTQGAKEPATKEGDRKPVFLVARRDLYCASDPDFLNSSPLVSPANFLLVKKGTVVFATSFGGVWSGRVYIALSAGGREQIYVYRDRLESSFERVDFDDVKELAETLKNQDADAQ